MSDLLTKFEEPPFRVVDLQKLLAEPPTPLVWVCDDVAAAGLLTTLVSKAGLGKSWIGLLLAAGVHHGTSVGGIECAPGHAIYFDAENGRNVIRDRLLDARIGAVMTYIEADRLDLGNTEHLLKVEAAVMHAQATLVVFDSLKALTPRARENENDDMAPIVRELNRLARRTRTAVLVLHHQSDKDHAAEFRGASAIKDQSDLMLLMSGTSDSIKLEASKFRVGPAPPVRHFGLRDEGGIVTIEPMGGPNKTGKEARFRSEIVALTDDIRRDGGWTKKKISTAIEAEYETEQRTVSRAMKSLCDKDGWTLESTKYHPPPDPAEE